MSLLLMNKISISPMHRAPEQVSVSAIRTTSILKKEFKSDEILKDRGKNKNSDDAKVEGYNHVACCVSV